EKPLVDLGRFAGWSVPREHGETAISRRVATRGHEHPRRDERYGDGIDPAPPGFFVRSDRDRRGPIGRRVGDDFASLNRHGILPHSWHSCATWRLAQREDRGAT